MSKVVNIGDKMRLTVYEGLSSDRAFEIMYYLAKAKDEGTIIDPRCNYIKEIRKFNCFLEIFDVFRIPPTTVKGVKVTDEKVIVDVVVVGLAYSVTVEQQVKEIIDRLNNIPN